MSVYEGFSSSRPASRWGPLVIGAAFAAVAVAGQTRFGAWLRGFLSVSQDTLRQNHIQRKLEEGCSLEQLRDSIVGRRKPLILAIFGSPRTAATGGELLSPDVVSAPAIWRADTWYYVVDDATRTAMAIRFTAGVAQQVDFFDAPQPAA